MPLELIVLAVLLGLIPAFIAQKKGYSFLTWWIGGTLLFIIALPEILMKKPNRAAQQQCPACMSWIDRQASVCPQCSRDVVRQDA